MDALLREKGKNERTHAILLAQHVLDVQKCERKSEREYNGLIATLQRQVGLEQTRQVDIQLQWTRAESKFNNSVLALETKFSKEHAARNIVRDELEVCLFFLTFWFGSFFIVLACALGRVIHGKQATTNKEGIKSKN